MTTWPPLLWIALAEFLAMTVWFSASAVVPPLTAAWSLTEAQRAWLTMSVQGGFVLGTLTSALLNLPDRMEARRLFAASAFLAGAATLLIPQCNGPWTAIPLRVATGFLLAGVYPVGMKLIATWTVRNRGFGIGLLVGALTLGSAAPHLIRAIAPVNDWRAVLCGAGMLAVAGAFIAVRFVRPGPYATAAPPFHWRYAGELFRKPELRLANLGYLGHMWELYAMWAWMPVFLGSPMAAFAAIAAGGIGCLAAGRLADRIGRTWVTSMAMAASGLCALSVGWLHGGFAFAVCVVWGFTVVADSAQFSAAVTEMCTPEYSGTALTIQNCLGFLLTLASIRLVPLMEARFGWGWAFAMLAIGPACGAVAMLRLRRQPEAVRMAGGKF